MRLAVLALALLAAPLPAAELCEMPLQGLRGTEQKSWIAGTQRLVVCETGNGVFVIHTGRGGRQLLFQSEHTEWDYTAAPPKYTFTVYTWRSHAEPRVPLLRFEVTLTTMRARPEAYFVLRGKRYSEERFQQHLREFRDPATSEMRRQDLLSTMRDEGVSKPARALELLRSLEGEGFIAKVLSGVIADLELARRYPHAS